MTRHSKKKFKCDPRSKYLRKTRKKEARSATNKRYYAKMKLRRERERLRLVYGDRIDSLLPEAPVWTQPWFLRNV